MLYYFNSFKVMLFVNYLGYIFMETYALIEFFDHITVVFRIWLCLNYIQKLFLTLYKTDLLMNYAI